MPGNFLIYFILLLLTFNLKGQSNSDSIQICRIDSFIGNLKNNNELKSIHLDGKIIKKRLLLFRKVVGGNFVNINYRDTMLYSIENFDGFFKSDIVIQKSYYYSNNQLIKYVLKETKSESLHREIAVYYNQDRLIGLIQTNYESFAFDYQNQQNTIADANKQLKFYLSRIHELNSYSK